MDPYEADSLYGVDSLPVDWMYFDLKAENKGVISPAVSLMQLHTRASVTVGMSVQ